MPKVDSLDHLVLTVADIARAIAFHQYLLGPQFMQADDAEHVIEMGQVGA
jgi:hypothetical protein